MSFLDILVKRQENGSLSLDLFKKKTFSGRYVNFLSAHSTQVKIGIIKSITYKILTLSDPQYHLKNFREMEKDLILNNYPKKFIDKYCIEQIKKMKSIEENEETKNCDNNNSKEEKRLFVYRI